MRIELEKRPQHSAIYSVLSPFIAFALTLVFGAVLFALLGKNPATALYIYFISPLSQVWQLHELVVKAAPLILIAVGLSVCYRSNNWNIGAEGQFVAGAVAGSILPVMDPGFQSVMLLPLMMAMGMIGGALYACIPAILKARFNANEILSSLMLVYVANLFLDWMVRGPWRDPMAHGFPQTIQFSDAATLPAILPSSGRASWDLVFALVAAFIVWFMMSKTLKGFEVKLMGQSPRAGRFAGFSSARVVVFSFVVSGALAGLAGIAEVSANINQLQPVISPGYGFTAIIVAFLGRLNPLGIVIAGLVLALSYIGGEAAQTAIGISDKTASVFQGMLLFFVLASDTLIYYRIRLVRPQKAARGRPSLVIAEAILTTVATAATPLLLAATGELVVERSGVLNLGVEGMMLMGAVSGFAGASLTGNPWFGVLAAVVVGAAYALLFGFLTLTLVTNQVATGLALTLLGVGLSGLMGELFVGQPGVQMTSLRIPGLTELPLVGKLLFGEDPLFYISIVLVAAVSWFLFRTRVGLTLRSVGDNHSSAHALGIPVVRIRYLAVMFGGACAGLGGAQLSLVYTPQWVENMTAGRGWIALALVVFASWRPWRVLAGAYLFGALTILELNIQAVDPRSIAHLPQPFLGLLELIKSIPSQFLSSIPYLATVVVLVVISRNRRLTMMNTPATLGRAFVPDR